MRVDGAAPALNVFQPACVIDGDTGAGSTLAGRVTEAFHYRRSNMQKMRAFIKDSKGATAIEYGLIAALIAVAAITAMGTLGNQLSTTFTTVSGKMNTSVR